MHIDEIQAISANCAIAFVIWRTRFWRGTRGPIQKQHNPALSHSSPFWSHDAVWWVAFSWQATSELWRTSMACLRLYLPIARTRCRGRPCCEAWWPSYQTEFIVIMVLLSSYLANNVKLYRLRAAFELCSDELIAIWKAADVSDPLASWWHREDNLPIEVATNDYPLQPEQISHAFPYLYICYWRHGHCALIHQRKRMTETLN